MSHTALDDIKDLLGYTNKKSPIIDFLRSNVHISGGIFTPSKKQEQIIEHLQQHQYCAFLNPRRIGTSSAILGQILYDIIHNPYTSVGICSNGMRLATYSMLGLTDMLNSMTSTGIQVVRNNSSEIALCNGSRVRPFSTETLGIARGLKLDYLFLDHMSLLTDEANYELVQFMCAEPNTKVSLVINPTQSGMKTINGIKKFPFKLIKM